MKLPAKTKFYQDKRKQRIRAPSNIPSSAYKKINAYRKNRESYFNDVLFIPFGVKWEISLSISITIAFLVNLNIYLLDGALRHFKLKYTSTKDFWVSVILCLTEAFYIIDLLLLTLHKILKGIRITRSFEAKSTMFLLIGYVSVIPSLFSIYRYLINNEELSYVRLLVSLRLHRNFLIYRYLINSIYLSELIIVLAYLSLLCTLTGILATLFIFYLVHVAKTKYLNIEDTLLYLVPVLNYKVLQSWPITTESDLICWAYFIGGTSLLGRSPFNIYPTNILYLLVYQGWMLLTILIRMTMIGIFASIVVKKSKANVDFNTKKLFLGLLMDKMDLPKANKNYIIKWYDALWKARNGFTDTYVKQLLHSGLYEDCYLDCYYPALMHSHLFRNIDKIFAAALATAMNTVFYNAKETIFKKGEIQSEMIYIHTGTVHVMSVSDDNTPIVTLFPGTCFGESTLIISYPVNRRYACATYCELMILTKQKFYEVGQKFRTEFKYSLNTILERYEKSFLLSAIREISRSRTITNKIGEHEDEPLKRIKRIARAIDKTYTLKSFDQFEQEDRLTELADTEMIKSQYVGSCSDYLDSLVISRFSQEDEKKTFVKSSFPLVFNPNSPFVKCWEILIFMGILFMLFTIPLEAGLGLPINYFQYVFSVFLQMLFLLDVIFQCFIAIITNEKTIGTTSEIFEHRMCSLGYKADIIGSIPFNIMAQLNIKSVSWSEWGYLKLNYTLRAWRICSLYSYVVTKSSTYREQFLLLIYFFNLVIYISYWSMIFSSLSCHDNKCDPNSMWMQSETLARRSNAFYVTIKTISDTLLLCLGEGGSYVIPFTMREHAAYMLMSVTFLFFNGITIASMCSVVMHNIDSYEVTKEMINPLLNILSKYDLPSDLEYRLFQQIKMKRLTYNVHLFIGSEQCSELSPDLIRELKMSVWIHSILQVPLFQNSEIKLINEVVDHCCSRIIPPNSIIVYSGLLPEFMYIIKSGYCQILGHKVNEIEGVKGPGWSFGILEILVQIPMTKTIRAETYCEIIYMNRHDLEEILKKFPQYSKYIQKTVKKCQTLRDLPIVEGVDSVLIHRDEKKQFLHHFSYGMVAGSKAESEFLEPFGKYTFLSYFLLRSVILPFGFGVWTLEIARSILALIACLFIPPKVLLLQLTPYFSIFFRALDIMAYVDIYLRMHVAYYNETGILVRHPLLTAIYYFKTSFLMDLLGCFPFEDVLKEIIALPNAEYWLCYNRVLQIHRIIGFLNYLYRRQVIQTPYIVTIKLFIIMISVTNLLASMLYMAGCNISSDIRVTDANNVYWYGIECPNLLYNPESFGQSIFPRSVYLYYTLYVTTLISQINTLKAGWDVNNGASRLIVALIGYIMITYMIAKVSAITCLQNTGFEFQQKVKELMKFLEQNGVSKDLQDEFSLHFNTLWEKQRGMNPKSALALVNNSLKFDVIYHIYGKPLKEHTIFAKSTTTFFRNLLVGCDSEIYYKGSIILSEGYVHNKVYMLYDGYVTVITGRRPVMTLKKGSFFGNLYNNDFAQNTGNIVAKSTVEVLVMKTSALYYILNAYPYYEDLFLSKLKEQAFQGICVIKHLSSIDDDYDESEDQNESDDQNIETSRGSKEIGEKMVIKRFHHHKTSTKYLTFKAILALVSSFFTLYTISMRDFTFTTVTILFVLDIMTSFTIINNCYTPFYDELHEFVNDPKEIKIHYRKKSYGFWFDVMTSFPFEVAWVLFHESHYAYLLFRFNRVFKFIIFWRYLREYHELISANQFRIKVICSIINFYCLLYFSTGIFLTVASWHKTSPHKDGSSYEKIDSFLRMLLIIFSDFSNYPHPMIVPYVRASLTIFRIIQMIMTINVVATIIGHMLFYIETFYHAILCYLEKRKSVLFRFKLKSLSLYLYKCVDNYLRFLWDLNRGIQNPKILSFAPISLQQKLLKSLYGYHLKNHFIFRNCQESFLDQVILNFSRKLVLPGNTIVRQGTKDDCMYFIHKGIVRSHSKLNDINIFNGALSDNDYFGTIQGLNQNLSHTNTYKAYSVVIILKLHFPSWMYLLKHFPMEHKRIYNILHKRRNEIPFNY